VTSPLASRVRYLREKRSWTAQQLADECNRRGMASLTRATIAKLESGIRKSVTAEELGTLAMALDTTPTELLKPPSDRERFVSELRELWRGAGSPSLRTLSARTQIPRTTLGAILNGTSLPSELLFDRLITTLGVNKSAELAKWHKALEDAQINVTLPVTSEVQGERPMPRQLPPANPLFVGRSETLAKIVDQIRKEAKTDSGRAYMICVVRGTAGVGKSMIANQLAHRLADDYPDGHIFVNFRSHAPKDDPTDASVALNDMLHSLGVGEVPNSTDAKAALLRSITADKRMLMVFDDVMSSEQIRPLLPGGSRSTVIVTSRSNLDGLVIREGAAPVDLSVFDNDAAMELFARRLGQETVETQRDAVQVVINMCGGLPLALSIASARLALWLHETPDEISKFADELKAKLSNADYFEVFGHGELDLGAIFESSFRALSEEHQRLIEAIASLGGEFDVAMAAEIADISMSLAFELLRDLAAQHLVIERSPGTYAMHDLIRQYASRRSRSKPAYAS
jgi:transcriptional regulator with XRE-family HTH domain